MPRKLLNELRDALVELGDETDRLKTFLLAHRCLSPTQVRTFTKWVRSAVIQLKAAQVSCRTTKHDSQ